MSIMPRALPISRIKNSGAFFSFSADPMPHNHITPPRNRTNTIWKPAESLSTINMPAAGSVDRPLTPPAVTA